MCPDWSLSSRVPRTEDHRSMGPFLTAPTLGLSLTHSPHQNNHHLLMTYHIIDALYVTSCQFCKTPTNGIMIPLSDMRKQNSEKWIHWSKVTNHLVIKGDNNWFVQLSPVLNLLAAFPSVTMMFGESHLFICVHMWLSMRWCCCPHGMEEDT